jgi:hypothetical protein
MLERFYLPIGIIAILLGLFILSLGGALGNFLFGGILLLIGCYVSINCIYFKEGILVHQSSSQSTKPATGEGGYQKQEDFIIPPQRSVDDEAIKILQLRYAKGEISAEKYDEMMEQLIK